MILPILTAIAAAAAAPGAAPPATARTEMLGIDAPDSFTVGDRARADGVEIIELVEAPETVQNWTRLVTLLLFRGAAERTDLDAFWARWRQSLAANCRGMRDSFVRGTVDGRLALRATLSCPQHPVTGKPENLEAIVVEGEANLMMVQVAFRHPLRPEDRALIEHVAASLKICDERSFDACSARDATGFQAAEPAAR